MSVWLWFVVGAGSAAYLWAFRYYAGRVAWNEKSAHRERPDGGDVIWGMICGTVLALVSPILFPWEQLRNQGTWRGLTNFMTSRALHTPAEWRDQ